MAVPVALGKTVFDTTALKDEHKRLATKLINPVARDAMDPAQEMTFAVTLSGTPRRFSLYMKAFFDREGDAPTYNFYFKDDSNVEQFFPSGIANLAGPPANVQMVDINGSTTNVFSGDGLSVDPTTGRILLDDGTHLGQVKFEAISGLEVAQINTRLTDVNNALDGLTKILTVLNSNIDAGISLIR